MNSRYRFLSKSSDTLNKFQTDEFSVSAIEIINIFLFQNAIWRVYICTVVNAVLSQCNIAAADICRAKKKGVYLNLARSRNKMSKGTLEVRGNIKISTVLLLWYSGVIVSHLNHM